MTDKFIDECEAMAWMLKTFPSANFDLREHDKGWDAQYGGENKYITQEDSPSRAEAICGLANMLRAEKQSVCPLPEVGSNEWGWRKLRQNFFTDEIGGLCVGVSGETNTRGLREYEVVYQDKEICAKGEARTLKGAKRAGEKAAHKAWKLTHGRKA